ncbi:MAG: GxxExxY protein [Verrucomicrobia bacterium]|nr:GxxExxY protein [Verrucomicrobiota bacterium]MBI3867022.1 GxxExxY protein [Verrucomicrobiota bacterium]
MSELIHRVECYQIIGACFEVYREKGAGFLEAVYQECLEIEFSLRSLPVLPKAPLPLAYKGHTLRQGFQPDFICLEKVILEIKAVSTVTDEHRAQILNYLHASDLKLGLLVNFGHSPQLEWERFANTRSA